MKVPFHPGTGTPPAHIAGRRQERRRIDLAIECIGEDTDEHGLVPEIEPPIVITGPRGVGKTVLLGLATKKARELDVNPVVLVKESLSIDPKKPAKEKDVYGKLKKFFSDLPIKPSKVRLGGKVEVDFTNKGDPDFRKAIELGLKKGPLLIVIDEAHSLDSETLAKICVSAQSFIFDRYPLSLMLAGTPGLLGKLRGVEATFMERARKLVINLLSKEETAEAISMGLEKVGMTIDPGPLESLVSWSDRYPYFVQLVGYAAWESAVERGSEAVAQEDVDRGIESANADRELFNGERYGELSNLNLQRYAVQAIKSARDHGKDFIEDNLVNDLMDNNRGMSSDGAKDVQQQFQDLGFLYKNGIVLEAGIPSFFDFVTNTAKRVKK